jgi:hypothetical protein
MSVVLLADVKTHLNITDVTYDAELQSMIDSAEATIVRKCGPLAPTATTRRVYGGSFLIVEITPAISLTSVTPATASPISVSLLHLEPTGIITYNSGQMFTDRYYDVAYSAGRTTCPADLALAVKELVRHLWDTQRGPTRRPGSESSQSAVLTQRQPGAGYLLPFRVLELIAPHLQNALAG